MPSNLDDVIALVLEHDGATKLAQFEASQQECAVCFNDDALGSSFTILPCGHYFCSECMTRLVTLCITENRLDDLVCPNLECTGEIGPATVAGLVDAELYAKYDRFSLQKALAAMEDVAFCPRPTCGTPSPLHAETQQGVCPKCNYMFCGLCLMTSHSTPCLGPEARVKMLKERAAQNKLQQQELLSIDFIARTSKFCPTCGAVIYKNGGCAKVTCIRCNQAMCWRCGVAILSYDHFQSRNASSLIASPIRPKVPGICTSRST
ncbi:uncharacterized protein AMSG_03668 [Thecamonas trahens ATCC 50062]|uniref:RBR-type E3 ubiquitin transferase n=1 Tax=Thecamonas trahens ATCC 50062 TaxID=461836 RepID=A0A0L0D4J6_THETB|nr:hypothetical protein AMSG_03668 [Thecamonas trahens ATCC 50062]KNC47239.1 hypothetical protein AMSG_03668 [Thecamonas trahens ATCC 50062]|eukprot:XP_013759582.1 hypothetical protein AMSG_03668 [Thecamonas trahens ATCC 50062]